MADISRLPSQLHQRPENAWSLGHFASAFSSCWKSGRFYSLRSWRNKITLSREREESVKTFLAKERVLASFRRSVSVQGLDLICLPTADSSVKQTVGSGPFLRDLFALPPRWISLDLARGIGLSRAGLVRGFESRRCPRDGVWDQNRSRWPHSAPLMSRIRLEYHLHAAGKPA